MDRRKFIKDISLIGLGLTLGPALLDLSRHRSSAQNISKLVIVRHPKAVENMKINSETAKKMVDKGIMQFTGKENLRDAWASILRSLSPNDVVSIKVNCINSSLPSHPEVVNAIVAGLIAAGVKENNIIIWDKTSRELARCGYKINTSDVGVRCFGSDESGWGYDKQVRVADKNIRLSKILTVSDHIINVPVLKNHNLCGVTLGMKNHYGSVDNPGSLHGSIFRFMQCDPYIAELNNVPEIRDKTRLIVLDGLIGAYQSGPGGRPQFVFNSIILGQDPVAVDYKGWEIIKAERQQHGMGMSQPKHIKTAAKLGLGINDPDSIRTETVDA